MRAIRPLTAAVLVSLVASGASAAPAKPALAGLAFLIGTWSAGTGVVADIAGKSKGKSVITSEAGGALLLRRDHTDLFDKAGKPAGAFDQIMTIYAESGAIHADYFDGTHIIHYTSAAIVPGKSVTFVTTAAPNTPAFRLSYSLAGPVLNISFAMAPPGSTSFHAIATGTVRKND